MEGNNHITLNEATMIEIVQRYFAKEAAGMMADSKVTSVKGGTENQCQLFTISIEKKDKQPA